MSEGSRSEKSFDQLFAELSKKMALREAQSETAEHEDDQALALEISQLLYRLQVLMIARGLTPSDIYRKL